jgi:hypothetical protein
MVARIIIIIAVMLIAVYFFVKIFVDDDTDPA